MTLHDFSVSFNVSIKSYLNTDIFYCNTIIAASEKKHIMKVVLVNSTPTSCSFLDYDESKIEDGDTSNCLLNLFGKPIITRNLSILGSLCEIDRIMIPKGLVFGTDNKICF